MGSIPVCNTMNITNTAATHKKLWEKHPTISRMLAAARGRRYRRRVPQPASAAAIVAEEMECLNDAREESEEIPELSLDATPSAKFKNSITNLLSNHCSEIKHESDNIIQSMISLSKRKLKETVYRHNNEFFSFMSQPDRAPTIIGIAESIFRKYNHDVPILRGGQGNQANMTIQDLNMDVSLNETVADFDKKLSEWKQEDRGLHVFMKQLDWIIQQYKNIGDQVLHLETKLYKKVEQLDTLHSRIPTIMSLSDNEVLPDLVGTFIKYAESVYANSQIEEDYKKLLEAYKKWNICRQIVSYHTICKQDRQQDPPCSICMVEPISFAIVPCGHTFCSNCCKKHNTTCHICRGVIREKVKLFFT